MTDAANNVRVCLRIRPLLEGEQANGDVSNATAMPDCQTVRLVTNQATYNNRLEAHQYRLDFCCGPEVSQRAFFHASGVESFCDSAVEGQAATVFCFGQTGSGKTYTMSGPHMSEDGTVTSPGDVEYLGLQYRGAHYIAAAVKETNRTILADLGAKGHNTNFVPITLRASYIEIYQEQVNDLLNGTDHLKVRWSQGAQSFFIENLMIVTCDDVDDLLAVLSEGGNNRKRASHKLNVDSTRSHVLFTIYFERRDAINAPPKYGKINFVDLAGSERLKDSESTGVNAEETKSINKSLFTLGKVISALSKRSTQQQGTNDLDTSVDEVFVPYRDSALTKLLMDSLGGSCRTLMVACVTPSQRFTDESLRTIIYAMRTKNIVNSMPRVRMDPTQRQVFELRTEIEMLRRENALLKARLNALEGGASPTAPLRGGGSAGGDGLKIVSHHYVDGDTSNLTTVPTLEHLLPDRAPPVTHLQLQPAPAAPPPKPKSTKDKCVDTSDLSPMNSPRQHVPNTQASHALGGHISSLGLGYHEAPHAHSPLVKHGPNSSSHVSIPAHHTAKSPAAPPLEGSSITPTSLVGPGGGGSPKALSSPSPAASPSHASEPKPGSQGPINAKPNVSTDGTVLSAAWAQQPTMTVASLKDFGFKPAQKKANRL